MNTRREILAEVFQDTLDFCREEPVLAERVSASRRGTRLYRADDDPALRPQADRPAEVSVSRKKTFQAAMDLHRAYPGSRIAVLNFASASTPGGGVQRGSSAQEESLCRSSTLYPALNQRRLWDSFYSVNRAAHDPLHTDDCIYSPNVTICKTDADIPSRLPPEEFVTVDVISCAAPNLRPPRNGGTPVRLSPWEMQELHFRRARHILHVAAANGADILVLGAFGCGVFANNPHIVARAFFAALNEYQKYFKRVEFAIFCRKGVPDDNFEAFRLLCPGRDGDRQGFDALQFLRRIKTIQAESDMDFQCAADAEWLAAERRENLVFGRTFDPAGYNSGGQARFESISVKMVRQMLSEGLIDPDAKHNLTPSVQEMVDFCSGGDEKIWYFHGFMVSPERMDCRITLEGFGTATRLPPSRMREFVQFNRDGDIMTPGEGEGVYSWYD